MGEWVCGTSSHATHATSVAYHALLRRDVDMHEDDTWIFNSKVGGTVELRILPASADLVSSPNAGDGGGGGGGVGGLGAMVFVERARGLRVDESADPFARVVRDGGGKAAGGGEARNKEGSEGPGEADGEVEKEEEEVEVEGVDEEDEDEDEDELGRTVAGRGSDPKWQGGQGIVVGRNPTDGEVHFRVQVWDADLWGNHTFLGVSKEIHLYPTAIRGQEVVITGLDMMVLPPVRPPTPYKAPAILEFPKIELMFGLVFYYGFCQACSAVLGAPSSQFQDPSTVIAYKVVAGCCLLLFPMLFVLLAYLIISKRIMREETKNIMYVSVRRMHCTNHTHIAPRRATYFATTTPISRRAAPRHATPPTPHSILQNTRFNKKTESKLNEVTESLRDGAHTLKVILGGPPLYYLKFNLTTW